MTGERVTLRPFREEDFAAVAAWKNDLRTQAWNQRQPMDRTPELIRERLLEVMRDPLSGLFAVETEDGVLAGQIQYRERPPRLAATIGIIFGREYWGKGYAREAHELVLRFVFVERGVQVARLWTTGANDRMMGQARKLGYRESARLREGCIIGGKAVDAVVMDMLREEWFESRGIEDPLAAAAGPSSASPDEQR